MATQALHPNEPSMTGVVIRPRSYQVEMLEESMKQNIIVAMDTGSGKTHVALLRIMTELERCPPDKLIWFLVPTVSLCKQQHEVISSTLPSVCTKMLIGSDDVHLWREQRIWDAVLKNVRIMVSTYDILVDALSHGFLKMSQLALLIFDEAHHCKRGHPANKIMRDFYHPMQELGQDRVPHILGLSASPIVRANPKELRVIEANLAAISKTPRLHREELMKHVNRPQMSMLLYRPQEGYQANIACQALIKSVGDIRGIENEAEQELKKFCRKAIHIFEELGSWAAEFFIHETVTRLKESVEVERQLCGERTGGSKALILAVLNQGPLTRMAAGIEDTSTLAVSDKVERLIGFLLENYNERFSGLLFVKQRTTVRVLSQLLAAHPRTRDRFRCAHFVGVSSFTGRKKSIYEPSDLQGQTMTLDDFRQGSKNLIISTDALEEGIDIPACNVVVCFDQPPNLKSFVQRRGRARQSMSGFAIMLAENDKSVSLEEWRRLEVEMIRIYQDDTRTLPDSRDEEDISEELREKLHIESTKATVTTDSAIAHLHHFCATLPPQPYADLRPVFSFEKNSLGFINATVTLPNCVSSKVRQAKGQNWWKSQRLARKDASFQAYLALYNYGLLNDNLLPLVLTVAFENKERGQLPSTMEVPRQCNPWVRVAEAWKAPQIHQSIVSIQQEDSTSTEKILLTLTTPMATPKIQPFSLYWNIKTDFTVQVDPARPVAYLNQGDLRIMREAMHTILRSTHSDREPDNRKDFAAIISPAVGLEQLPSWLTATQGRRPAVEEFQMDSNRSKMGYVRSALLEGDPFVFRRWHQVPVGNGETSLEVECIRLPRRRNILHRGQFPVQKDTKPGAYSDDTREIKSFSANDCTFDLLPAAQARLSLLMPPLIQHLEVRMVANLLCQTILKEVNFKDVNHVVTAISAPSSHWVTDYQRYEFLGDSILKFLVSWQLYIDHVDWYEGLLTNRRISLVSNAALAKAALDIGLSTFILTKSHTTRQWTAPLVSGDESRPAEPRMISAKILADVVESLTGAAFVDGGMAAARACIHTFLPDVKNTAPNFKFSSENHQEKRQTYAKLDIKCKSLINYRFINENLLLEALTHPSCERDYLTESYQRLEFLGDAVLDMIVVDEIFQHKSERSHGEMSMVKAALVNADLLAFLCMERSVKQNRFDIQGHGERTFSEVKREEQFELWKFMRHNGQDVTRAQRACRERYQKLQGRIEQGMSRGNKYPWSLLAQLNAEKFYSDMIESILGAIFVDSGGDLEPCKQFAERMGIMQYLRRILTEKVDVMHPKSKLGQLSGAELVDYIVQQDESGGGEYECTVEVGGRAVVTVRGSLRKEEARIRGADAAVELISATNDEADGRAAMIATPAA